MRTITFYSYKGGVGRSLAVANTAWWLADEGNQVFVMDLDLEAPGLHFKLIRDDERRRQELKGGVVELLDAYLHRGETDIQPEKYAIEIPTQSKGTIRLLAAGNSLRQPYWEALAGFSWTQMFGEEFGAGIPFFILLKEAIESKFNPDFLLVDARTGITDVGGVALTLLADDVVCLFSDNPESEWGTREAIRGIGRSLPPGKPLRVVPVLARRPFTSEHEREKRRRELWAKLFENLDVELPIGELCVLHSDRDVELDEGKVLGGATGQVPTGLAEEYTALFRELRIDTQLVDAKGKLDNGVTVRDRGDVDHAERLIREAIEVFADRGDPTLPRARLELSRALKHPSKATPQRVEEAIQQLDLARNRMEADSNPWLEATKELVGALIDAGDFNRVVSEVRTAVQQLRELRRDDHANGLLATSVDDLGRRYGGLNEEGTPAVLDRGMAERTLLQLDLASAHFEQQHFAESEEVLKSILGTPSLPQLEEARARRLLGRIKLTQGEPREAERYLRPAVTAFQSHLASDEQELKESREELRASFETPAALPVRGALRERSTQVATVLRPPPDALPPKRSQVARSSAARCSFDVSLRFVTPVLGGAAQTRTVDEIDIIRVPTIRGHLRFWWRALYGGRLSSEELYQRERALWGGAADDAAGRSPVEIRRSLLTTSEIDPSEVRAYGRESTRGAYALWPARGTTKGEDPAPRRVSGTRFTLHVGCPESDRVEIQTALRAYVLFGGYGSRTRRGTGSLTVDGREGSMPWLPREASRSELTALFGRDIFEAIPSRPADDTPLLAGAWLSTGSKAKEAEKAWATALAWLQDFRQGQPPSPLDRHDPAFARDWGDPMRPGRSNFPEADKVRRLSGPGRWAHDPRHNATPVYPRAGFGLPIIAQFQTRPSSGQRYPNPEPDGYELRWKDGKGKEHDRLASPLCLGIMPLADGQFAPYALWLFRSYPEGGMVGLKEKDTRHKGSYAAFDVLVAKGDTALFNPLDNAAGRPAGTRLRAAFFDWLSGKSTKAISP